MELPYRAVTWLFFTRLGISPNDWTTILAPTHGALPADEAQYLFTLGYLRRHTSLLSDPRSIRSKTFYGEYEYDEYGFNDYN